MKYIYNYVSFKRMQIQHSQFAAIVDGCLVHIIQQFIVVYFIVYDFILYSLVLHIDIGTCLTCSSCWHNILKRSLMFKNLFV